MTKRSRAAGSLFGHRGLLGIAPFALLAIALVVVTIVIVQIIATARRPVDWPGFGFDPAGSRMNPTETQISATTVQGLRRLWQTTLPDVADSSPAYLPTLDFPDGTTRDVLYFTTKSGTLVALDANNGAQLWAHKNPSAGPNMVTTSSPLADRASGAIYSYGMDGKVHKYEAVSGAELFGSGWPVTVTNMPVTEKESSALNSAHGFLYVTMASCCGDTHPYQGHVVAINLTTGAKHVFNAMCSDHTHLLQPGECPDTGAGIWARPGVVVDPVTGNIFLTTGNGPYTADQGGHGWGESVLELAPDVGRVIDSYTVSNPNDLTPQDLDLGSADPALLPVIPGGKVPYLAVQASKEGVLRLLNRQNLSGQGGPGHTGGELQAIDAPDHCPVLTQPAVWTDPAEGGIWVFVTNYCAIGGYRLVTSPSGATKLQQAWSVGTGASSPIVAGDVLFATATGDTREALALDPRSGRQLWSSAAPGAAGSIGTIHWESPIVIGGRLYCSDEQGQVTAYGLG
jgi:outer membrane protein assembly factor BamB